MSSGLSEIHLPPEVSRRLEHLEIRDIRQLYARLQGDRDAMRQYLGLEPDVFEALSRSIEAVIASRFPKDRLRHAYPAVNRKGVAAHRLHDWTRPRYGTRSKRGK